MCLSAKSNTLLCLFVFFSLCVYNVSWKGEVCGRASQNDLLRRVNENVHGTSYMRREKNEPKKIDLQFIFFFVVDFCPVCRLYELVFALGNWEQVQVPCVATEFIKRWLTLTLIFTYFIHVFYGISSFALSVFRGDNSIPSHWCTQIDLFCFSFAFQSFWYLKHLETCTFVSAIQYLQLCANLISWQKEWLVIERHLLSTKQQSAFFIERHKCTSRLKIEFFLH